MTLPLTPEEVQAAIDEEDNRPLTVSELEEIVADGTRAHAEMTIQVGTLISELSNISNTIGRYQQQLYLLREEQGRNVRH